MSDSVHGNKPITYSKPLILVNLVLLVLFFIVLLVIVLLNYATIIPIVVSGLILAGSVFIVSRYGWARFFKLLIIPFLLLLVVLAYLFIVNLFRGGGALGEPALLSNYLDSQCKPGDLRDKKELIDDRISITPSEKKDRTEFSKNFSKGSFTVTETITYNDTQQRCESGSWVDTDTKEIKSRSLHFDPIFSQKRSLFLREVVVDFGEVPEGFTYSDRYKVAHIEVELPINSFYDAQPSPNPETQEYSGNLTYAWEYKKVGQQIIRFEYIPSPYYYMSGPLKPFIDISTSPNWILAALGVVVNSLVLLNANSLFSELGKKPVADLFSKLKSAIAPHKSTSHEPEPIKDTSQPARYMVENERTPDIALFEIERMLQQAKAELDAKNLESAEKILQRISREKETRANNAQFWLLAGRLTVYQNNWQSAEHCFLQAKQLGDPQAEQALKWLQQKRSANQGG